MIRRDVAKVDDITPVVTVDNAEVEKITRDDSEVDDITPVFTVDKDQVDEITLVSMGNDAGLGNPKPVRHRTHHIGKRSGASVSRGANLSR